MILYPAIDLLGGACVRLAQGAFESAKAYDADPSQALERFKAAGAACVHVVDLDGAKDPAKRQTILIEALARVSGLKLQIGGGVRSLEDAAGLLKAGADRVVVGTLAVEQPEIFKAMLEVFGGDRLTLAVDIKNGVVASRGWQKRGWQSPQQLISAFSKQGLKRALCTDIEKDGMLQGPNLELYRSLRLDFPELELQASGGVGCLDDLLALKALGLHSTIVGKALYEGKVDLAEAVKAC